MDHRMDRNVCAFVALLMIVAICAGPAAALAGAYTQSASQTVGQVEHLTLHDSRDTPFFLKSDFESGEMSGYGYSDSGIAGVAASSAAFTGQNDFATGSASSEFDDSVVIDKPGLTGTQGTITLSLSSTFRVAGISAGSVETSGNYLAAIGGAESPGAAGDSFDTTFGGGFNGQPGTNDPFLIPTTVTGTFTFGKPIAFLLVVESQSVSQQFQDGTVQFGGSGLALGFGGIDSILDANANPVDAPSIQSAAGVDYSTGHDLPSVQVLPEPASLALLVPALWLLGRPARKRGT